MHLCLFCKGHFNSLKTYYKHLIDHKKNDSCKTCNEILPSTVKARCVHFRQHEQITCKICNTNYEKQHQFEHKKFHEYLYSVDQLNGIVDIINDMKEGKSSPTQAKRQKTMNIVKFCGTRPHCPVKNCKKKFGNQNDLINHFIYHRTNHLCEFCGEILPDDETYESHSLNKICRLYSCPCDDSDKDFSFDDFIHHITSECDILFDNTGDVEMIETSNERKIYRIHDETQYSFACFVCEEEFENMEFVRNHLKMHNRELNVCDKCFCVFDDWEELQVHVTNGCDTPEDLPINIREKLINEIEKFLETGKHLIANKKLYEMCGDNVLFQCNVCSSKFVKFAYLKEHCAKLNHELIMCYKCFFMFNTCNEFRKHYCVKFDYGTLTTREFREQFHKCFKRKLGTEKKPKKFIEKNENMNKLLNNNDVSRRVINIIKKLENTEFTNIKVTKTIEEDTPSTSVFKINDDYNLDKILPRILELRNKRLLYKPGTDEDSEEELEKVGNNLHDLDICKKHLLIENKEYDLDKVLPRILKLRNKRHLDEGIDDIDSLLAILGSPQNQEKDEPPNKRNRNEDTNTNEDTNKNEDTNRNDDSEDSKDLEDLVDLEDLEDTEDTSDYLIKIKSFIESYEENKEETKQNN